ncbi:MAG: hypothetical protein UT33_C0009G0051 [Candidatus Peregrinibacteria bacterium GW2011_GWC2_39_14]|nr:MAG: hypothetical protein US92_C0005G0051 [Candidatus Peregrinibacteria bacterium GW2011_GWA2_38_36]KKR06600.1 MAG: hypothetical protein UT33_C0009G0051 [Candidatus Peregrinibacteria bacterium GW2011_GWC2_39_14]
MCQGGAESFKGQHTTVMPRPSAPSKLSRKEALPPPTCKAADEVASKGSGLLAIGERIAAGARKVTGMLGGKGVTVLPREKRGRGRKKEDDAVVVIEVNPVVGGEVVEEVDMGGGTSMSDDVVEVEAIVVELEGRRAAAGGKAIAALEAAPQVAVQPTLPKINLPAVISLNSILHLVQDTPVERLNELFEMLSADEGFNNLPTDESDVVLMAMSIKRLVEERSSAEAITGYIGEQVRLLEQTSSAAILCNVFPRLSDLIRLAIADAQQELGMRVSVPEQVLKSVPSAAPKTSATPPTPSGLQAAVAREAAAAVQETAAPVPTPAPKVAVVQAAAPAPEKKPEFPKEITFGNLVTFVQTLEPGDLRAGTSLSLQFSAGLETKPFPGIEADARAALHLLIEYRSGRVQKKHLAPLVGEAVHAAQDPRPYALFHAILPDIGLPDVIAALTISKKAVAAPAATPAPKPQQKAPAPQAPAHQQHAPVAPPVPASKPAVHEASPTATLESQLKASQNPIKTFESLPEAQRAAFTGDEMMAARVAIITRISALRNQAVMGLPSKGEVGVLLQKLGLSEGAIAAKRAKESGAARSGTATQGAHRGLQQGAAPAENALFDAAAKAELEGILIRAKADEISGGISWNRVWGDLRRVMERNPVCRAEFAKHDRVFWLERSYLDKTFGRGWIEDNAPMFIRKQSSRQEAPRRY